MTAMDVWQEMPLSQCVDSKVLLSQAQFVFEHEDVCNKALSVRRGQNLCLGGRGSAVREH